MLQRDLKYTEVIYNKVEYGCYHSIVATNPMYSEVIDGMHLSDFESGFGNDNYGCHLEFSTESSSSLGVLVTWKEVIDGKTMVYRYGEVATITEACIQTSQTEVIPHKKA